MSAIQIPQRDTTRSIQTHFTIPPDFETSKQTYGALSGTCFEERVVAAYEMGLLPSQGAPPLSAFCSACGTEGHKAAFCPEELKTPGGSWNGIRGVVKPSASPTLDASPGDPSGVAKGATSAQGAYAGEESRGTPVRSAAASKVTARKSARKLHPISEEEEGGHSEQKGAAAGGGAVVRQELK